MFSRKTGCRIADERAAGCRPRCVFPERSVPLDPRALSSACFVARPTDSARYATPNSPDEASEGGL
eukprot:9779271-Alexandrium_andersonii.AAC.1